MFYKLIENVVNYFDNNILFTFVGIIITISGIMKTFYKTTKRHFKVILKVFFVLITAFYLYISFACLSGWKFWFSQAAGWLALFNMFVLNKFISILKKIPKEKDLLKK